MMRRLFLGALALLTLVLVSCATGPFQDAGEDPPSRYGINNRQPPLLRD